MVVIASLGAGVPAHAANRPVPDWAKPAVKYLVNNGHLDRASFYPNQGMDRAAFRDLMRSVFGRGYNRDKGKVTGREVSKALVKVLGRSAVAKHLQTAESPGGWSPDPGPWFGTEVVARELGLRYNRPQSEDRHKRNADQPIRQADVAYAVWKARTSPSTYSGDALAKFSFPNLGPKRKRVVNFALSQVGTSYVWGGEWPTPTPAGYPYGAQAGGGFDCSGFVWYVLQSRSTSYDPPNRPYKGWSISERSSAQMAAATKKKDRLGFGKLKPADVLLFSAQGRQAKPTSVYHAGIYLGKGWMVHSSGSRAGVSISEVGKGSWWRTQFAWGRRVIT